MRAMLPAIELGACRIVNIKVGRVGGFTEAKKIHDVAQANSVPVWCGGMLETGIGRAHNVASRRLKISGCQATSPLQNVTGKKTSLNRKWKSPSTEL
jgi:O-succinylbenzoate synthase